MYIDQVLKKYGNSKFNHFLLAVATAPSMDD